MTVQKNRGQSWSATTCGFKVRLSVDKGTFSPLEAAQAREFCERILQVVKGSQPALETSVIFDERSVSAYGLVTHEALACFRMGPFHRGAIREIRRLSHTEYNQITWVRRNE